MLRFVIVKDDKPLGWEWKEEREDRKWEKDGDVEIVIRC